MIGVNLTPRVQYAHFFSGRQSVKLRLFYLNGKYISSFVVWDQRSSIMLESYLHLFHPLKVYFLHSQLSLDINTFYRLKCCCNFVLIFHTVYWLQSSLVYKAAASDLDFKQVYGQLHNIDKKNC